MLTDAFWPTLKPAANFKAENDCEVLRKAMKGLGTDEAALIDVLCKRTWQERCDITQRYKQIFGKSLEEALKSEISGNFLRVMKRLLLSPIELAAYELHKAMEGAGTDEDCLVEIICTKSSEELRMIQEKYKEMFGKTLETDIKADTSGYFKRLLVLLLNCPRPFDMPPDWQAALADASNLYEAGEGRLGTDETRFNTIFCTRSYSQLRAIFEVYAREYKRDIVDAIRDEFSGDIARALVAVVEVIRNRPGYFAKSLHNAMKGAGTSDIKLIRIIVSRADIDLNAIKIEFDRMYGKSLRKAVEDETSGDYKKALKALIGKE